MTRLKVTCPNSGHLEEIEFFEKAADGTILGVVRCSAFEPDTEVECDLVCAKRMNRRLNLVGGPASPDAEGDRRGDADGPWSPAQSPQLHEIVADVVTRMPIAREIMTADVVAVAPDTSLETAARLMVSRRITGMPVVRGDTPIGVITMSDLVDPDSPRSDVHGFPIFYRLGGLDGPVEDGDVDSVGPGRVSDVMSPFVLSIEASASITEAASRMLAESVHRLLVREGTRLVGIVTMTDLLRGYTTLFAS